MQVASHVEADASTWEAMLSRLFALHQGRFGQTRDWRPVYRQMRAVAGEALARRELGLFEFELDGEAAALELSVRREDRAFTLMCAYEPRFDRFSAGTLLRAHTLERWQGAGLRTIDLGPGQFAWKDQFRAVGVPVISLLVARRHSLAASCLLAWESVVKPALKPAFRFPGRTQ
jgi:CelD/BcsL family acetyltransferase involved in cellulose biosynthesis